MVNFTSALIKTTGFNLNANNTEKKTIYINPDKVNYFEEHKSNMGEIKKNYPNLGEKEIARLVDETKNIQGTIVHMDNKTTIKINENIDEFVKLFSRAKQEDRVVTANGLNYIA